MTGECGGILSTFDDDWRRQRMRLRWRIQGDLKYVFVLFCLKNFFQENSKMSASSTFLDFSGNREQDNMKSNTVEKETSLPLVCCRFLLATRTTRYSLAVGPISADWNHITLVYYDPNDGIAAYIDGSLIASNSVGVSSSAGSQGNTTGHVILGRGEANRDENYADLTVDELCFWNQALNSAVIQELYNLY